MHVMNREITMLRALVDLVHRMQREDWPAETMKSQLKHVTKGETGPTTHDSCLDAAEKFKRKS